MWRLLEEITPDGAGVERGPEIRSKDPEDFRK
jgi:hypothetical protein